MHFDHDKDYYAILGVHPNAEDIVIKAAYRAMSKHYHPDKGLGSTQQMQAINEAYQILADPARRSAYDLARSTFFEQKQQQKEKRKKRKSSSAESTRATKDSRPHPNAAPEKKIPPLIFPPWLSGLYVFAQAGTLGLFALGMLMLTLFDTMPFSDVLRFAFPLGLVTFSCICAFLALGPEGPGFRAIFARPLALPEEQERALAGRELCIHAGMLLVLALCIIARYLFLLHGHHAVPLAHVRAVARISGAIGGAVLLASTLYHYLTGRLRWPRRVQVFSMSCAFYPPCYAAWGLAYGGFFLFE